MENRPRGQQILILFFLIGAVFSFGAAVGAGALYFRYAKPEIDEGHRRMVFVGEGYNLIVRGETLKVENNPVFWKAETKKKVVALTFDDGPNPIYTNQVLSILKAKNVKATFFVVGAEARKYPDIVKAESDAGCEVENHSYTHPQIATESDDGLFSEIDLTNKAIKEITGKQPLFFRPPKGMLNDKVFAAADAGGNEVVFWSGSLERGKEADAKANAYRLAAEVKPGDIILAHDGRIDRSRTIEALAYLIDALKARGFEFVTLEELSKTR